MIIFVFMNGSKKNNILYFTTLYCTSQLVSETAGTVLYKSGGNQGWILFLM